jgi:LemA protein
VVAAGLVLAVISYWSLYNGLHTADESVSQHYSQVQNAMQRQADLIPALVKTVRESTKYESSVLIQVTEARSKLSAVAKMDPEKLSANPELQRQLIEASQAAGVSLSAVREAYPDLKANANFQSLMAELSGSQNRIAQERRKAQLATEAYNRRTRTAVSGWVARRHGFERRDYFRAESQASAPTVEF